MMFAVVVISVAWLALAHAQQPTPSQPGAQWSEAQLREAVAVARVGRKLTPKETIERLTGSPTIDPQPYLTYLREKLAALPAGA